MSSPTQFQIPKVSQTSVPVDIDLNSDGHLASISCVPAAFSNDSANISNETINGVDAFCVSFEGETAGVLGPVYKNCITADGRLTTLGPLGVQLSPSMTEEGKTRMATLIAQAYDCYMLNTSPAALSVEMMHAATEGGSDVGKLSQAMMDSAPYITFGILPVDIDQSGAFPPTIGAVTAATATVDDLVLINEPEVDEATGLLKFCMEMESELPAPYGEGARVCLLENGDISSDSIYPAYYDKTRLMQNMATAFNQYMGGSSAFAQDVVANASSLKTPAAAVPKKDAVEEQGIGDFILNVWIRQADACAESPYACPF